VARDDDKAAAAAGEADDAGNDAAEREATVSVCSLRVASTLTLAVVIALSVISFEGHCTSAPIWEQSEADTEDEAAREPEAAADEADEAADEEAEADEKADDADDDGDDADDAEEDGDSAISIPRGGEDARSLTLVSRSESDKDVVATDVLGVHADACSSSPCVWFASVLLLR
jgi:hypothetical protein